MEPSPRMLQRASDCAGQHATVGAAEKEKGKGKAVAAAVGGSEFRQLYPDNWQIYTDSRFADKGVPYRLARASYLPQERARLEELSPMELLQHMMRLGAEQMASAVAAFRKVRDGDKAEEELREQIGALKSKCDEVKSAADEEIAGLKKEVEGLKAKLGEAAGSLELMTRDRDSYQGYFRGAQAEITKLKGQVVAAEGALVSTARAAVSKFKACAEYKESLAEAGVASYLLGLHEGATTFRDSVQASYPELDLSGVEVPECPEIPESGKGAPESAAGKEAEEGTGALEVLAGGGGSEDVPSGVETGAGVAGDLVNVPDDDQDGSIEA